MANTESLQARDLQFRVKYTTHDADMYHWLCLNSDPPKSAKPHHQSETLALHLGKEY